MKSYNKPTNRQLDQAIPLLSSPQHEAYFFARLENPHWIGALSERGVFTHPRKVEQVKGGGVRFPAWPPGHYLARMAEKAPDEVAAIFAAIQTDNPSVIADVLKGASQMPPDVAASLVPTISSAARKGTLWNHFEDASDLCVQLAEGDQFDAALTLADALFAPRFDKTQERPILRVEYWYNEGLKQVVPVLARKKPHGFLPRLCDWLMACVEAKKGLDADYSYLWRPAVEEHEQNPDYDLAGVMVGFVRQGLETAIRSGSLPLQAAIEIIERYPHIIFERTKLHVLGEFADENSELVRQTMLNREFFDNYHYKHEYAMLVGRRLDLLLSNERMEWFSWIDAGPDMSDLALSKKNLGRDELPEEDRLHWVHQWQLEKLHWVRTHLDETRRNYYEKLVAQYGEPELADMHVRVSSGWVANESPMTLEQFTAMTFEQVVGAVSKWRPEKSRFMGPSMTGLGSTFEQYVGTDPAAFSPKARILVDRPAIFVRGFINKMAEAVDAGSAIDLHAVLDLCDWVIGRPVQERTTFRQEGEPLADENWQWTRDQISRFVENVCKAESGGIPRYALDGLRQRMWQLTASLCLDRAESYIVHDVSKEDPRLHDFLDIAINSPRGKAVEAAVEYGRWVAKHVKQFEGKLEVVPGGFDAMPEVREMLEWQIAPENRSFEALAILGSRVGLIYWIDKKWLSENAERLFSLEDIEGGPAVAHGWAAWNAFLIWTTPHIEFYRIFKSQFAYAVEHAAKVKLKERNPRQPMHHLGEHLLILHGRGQVGLDDDERLLRRFIESANSEVRRHAIEFVGRTLDRDDKIPEVIIERFQKLWDFYWDGPGRKDAEEASSAWLFGTWFSCGKFPESWALDRLQQFVEVNRTPEPDHIIAAKLARIAHVDIVKSVQILDTVVRNDREGWRIGGWLDSAKEILAQALRTSGQAKDQALVLIDYLGRRGYTDVGKLLRRDPLG
jgi:hypothetical protein